MAISSRKVARRIYDTVSRGELLNPAVIRQVSPTFLADLLALATRRGNRRFIAQVEAVRKEDAARAEALRKKKVQDALSAKMKAESREARILDSMRRFEALLEQSKASRSQPKRQKIFVVGSGAPSAQNDKEADFGPEWLPKKKKKAPNQSLQPTAPSGRG